MEKIFVNDEKSQMYNRISWFSKNCNFEKNCHEPNEYRWYQREVATGHVGWMH